MLYVLRSKGRVIREFNPKIVSRIIKFRIPKPEEDFSQIDVFQKDSAEVLVIPYLPEGHVAYRAYSKAFMADIEPLLTREFDQRPIEDVILDLRFCAAEGDFDALEALVPSRSANKNPSYRPNVLDDISWNVDGDPGPNRPNVLRKSVRRPSTLASSQDTQAVKLSREYVRWAQKLPDDELMWNFGRGRFAICPDHAFSAFAEYAKKAGLGHPNSRAKLNIRRAINENPDLESIITELIRKARKMRKN